MYLDPRVPQSKEVPMLPIAGGAPTEVSEGEAGEEAVAIDLSRERVETMRRKTPKTRGRRGRTGEEGEDSGGTGPDM